MFDFLNQEQLPENWEYRSQKKKIEQKKDIATQIQNWRYGGELKNFNSGYTAGGLTNPLSTLASIGAAVVGAKLRANASNEEDALNNASDKLYREGIRDLQKPSDQETWDAEKSNAMMQFVAGDTPPGSIPTPVQTQTPVVQTQVQPQTPVTQQPKPVQPKKRVLAKTVQGRGSTGRTADQIPSSYIDDANLREQMQVYPEPRQIPSPWLAGKSTAGEDLTPKNMGIDQFGQSQMTPQQIERAAARTVPLADGQNPYDFVASQKPVQSQLKGAPTPAPTTQPTVQPTVQPDLGAGGGRGFVHPQNVDPNAPRPQMGTTPFADAFLQDQQKQNEDFARTYVLSKAKDARDAASARMEDAKQKLIRSGDRGRTLVDAMDQAELAPKNPRNDYVVVGDRLFDARSGQFVNDSTKLMTVNPGQYVVDPTSGRAVQIGTDQSANEIKQTIDTPQGLLAVYKDGSTKIIEPKSSEARKAAEEEQRRVGAVSTLGNQIQKIQESAARLISDGTIDHAAAGMLNSAGVVLNRTLGVHTQSAAARSKIDAWRAGLIPTLMADFQASGASVNKVADTRRELDLHLSSYGNLDYERLSAQELRTELDRIVSGLLSVYSRKKAELAASAPASAAKTTSPIAPSGRPWTP